MGYYDREEFANLKGKVLVEINAGDDNIHLVTSEGKSYDMYHDQDCCEHVRVESIVGDLKDLLGHPLLMAEEVSNEDNPDYKGEYYDSYTWTFYKLATIKGYVDIRWLGESNGYYSESVSLNKGREYTEKEVQALIEKNNLNNKIINQVSSTFKQALMKENGLNENEGFEDSNIQPENEGKEIYQKKNSRFNL